MPVYNPPGVSSGDSPSFGGIDFTDYLDVDPVTLADGATITPNANDAVQVVTIAGNRTVAAPSNLQAGRVMTIIIIQDGTGSRTLSWNAVYKWPGGSAPTLTTTAAAIDVVSGYCRDGTNVLMGAPVLDVS